MTVTSTATAARQGIIIALNAEFADLGLLFGDDKLDESIGWDGVYGAVYPEVEEFQQNHANVWDATLVIQFFGKWDKKIDPKQAVSPVYIEDKAERMKRALRAPSHGTTKYLWYYNLIRIEYPDDPTGNKTRFEAVIVATGQNSAIINTTG